MRSEEWFVRAEQFWAAGAILAREQAISGEMLFFPNVVCRAFAAETYLKCLLSINEVPFSKVHNLRKLFRKLPLVDRTAIIENWTRDSLPGVISRAQYHPKGSITPDTFEKALKQSAEAFSQFRYAMRSDNYWTLAAFPVDVRRQILGLMPSWATHAPQLADLGISTTSYPKIEAKLSDPKGEK